MSAAVTEATPATAENAVLPPVPEESFADVVERHVAEAPDAPCLEYLGVSLTYRDVDTWANRCANLLRDHGAKAGDVVGLHLPNTPQYIVGLLAASKLGCAASGVSPLLTASELAYQVENAGIGYLISLDQLFVQAVAPNDGKMPSLKLALATGPIDFLPGWKKFLARVLKKVPAVTLPHTEQFATLDYWRALTAAPATRVHTQAKLSDVVLIQYTGGTTGKPKGAALTLSNLQSNAMQSEMVVDYNVGEETFASVFPYFHAAGLAVCLMALRERARLLVAPDPRDLKTFCKAMQQFPPTLFGNVPTLYQMLLDEPEFRKVDFSQLKIALSGAGPMPVDVIPKIEAVVGASKFCEAYGLTETSPMLTINPPGRTKPGSVGPPVPGTDIKIVDAETGDQEMPTGEAGELIAHGPQVFGGYLGLPEESKKALREFEGKTYFYTGDIAKMDEEGYVTICDRSKDMLIVGGFKVFSVEVESKLKALDEVELSAVIGTPDEKRPGNDVVNLYVQLSESAKAKDEAAVKDSILAFCREHMAAYKVPKKIHIIDAIPLTPIGKVDKKALRN